MLGNLMIAVVLGIVGALDFVAAVAAETPVATLVIHADRPGPIVDRHIFGQFAEHLGTGIYGGVWVGPGSTIPNTRGYRTDVVAALRAIHVPVVRWPGGCFADEYNWREGIGPRERRPVKINTHWGGVTEPNSFGTHEFMDFAELIGADAYVSGNVGSATPREMADWIEYMTSPAASTLANERRANGRDKPWTLAYLGLGNELWGCGGHMRPQYAADLTRRFAEFAKAPADVHIAKIASGANVDDYAWTETMMREAAPQIDGIALHDYTVPGTWREKGSATDFDEADYARTMAKTLRMDDLIAKHAAIMDKYDPAHRVALFVDEWGTWYDPTPGSHEGFLQQQNTLRDALAAASNFNIFVKHADRVKMTNIAQMVNVLQALIFTRDQAMVLTPTYHVYAMFRCYQDATSLAIELMSPTYRKDTSTMPAVSVSAVRDAAGQMHVGLVNLDPNTAITVSARLTGTRAHKVTGRVLSAATLNALNGFDAPHSVEPAAFTGARLHGDQLSITLPPKSVTMLDVDSETDDPPHVGRYLKGNGLARP